MQRPIKLILTDIDRTILPHGHRQISERCAAAMHAALDAGLRVGPASGRGLPWIAGLMRNDPALYDTALATSGMQVILNGEKIYEAVIDRDALVELAAWCHEFDDRGLVCFDGSTPLIVEGTVEGVAACFPMYAPTAQLVSRVPDGPTIKANLYVVGPFEHTREVVDQLNREMPALTFDTAETNWSNVTPHGWTKSSGIDYLCDRLGIGLDQVVVFGDANNDVTMLKHVPCSVAVANATPDAAAAARWHIGACEDDAVADAIEALARGEFPFVR